MHATAAEYFPTTIFFQYVNWGFNNKDDRDTIMRYIVEISKNGFGGPDIMNAEPKWGGITKYVLNNLFGSYYSKYKGIAPICTENQSGGYYANDALTLFNYAVDEVGVNFLPWMPITGGNRAWNIHDAIKVVNEQKGRINTAPPLNIIGSKK